MPNDSVVTLKARLGLWFSVLAMALLLAGPASAQDRELLNSSYDIARELFAEYNKLFAEHWEEKTGETVSIKQSHSGSSKQARSILQGMDADVVTYNQVTDVNILAERGNLIPEDWASRLPNNSSPYYSTMAFVVREGNPKNIENWDDLVREDVELIMPNPKTSGNGRYSYLAALGYAQNEFGDDQERIDGFMSDLLGHVKVFDSGGRSATTTFVERGLGDVLMTFESEAMNIPELNPEENLQVVVPEVSFLAEFPVAWIDENIEKKGNEKVAKAYLEHLYSEEAQRMLAGFNYRVHNETVKEEVADQFPDVKLMPIQEIAGDWQNAMETHFSSGGKLDQLQRR
ncbi:MULTISPECIES: thiosulfate ABC transporter substrate-binding protein CysP [Halomonadaceae]|jgi:sulfate transport system substrate-binding protein|uniref:Sulfate ABC transporter substrate-binding protein n=1 Tax=Vreelandella halophila TaxID=86177 RepID=A0A9X4YD07_9GAMM|nr:MULTISPECIES: thiosulfate ABC transporter substrate-binding protein CysP [Halomonas]MYL27429.1 sulfate ABC transporter substrate-binding protein [Halomonas utahensis]MYL74555.1 sulfate ABC transporter substrate-binding protein [Halomonas sp. 22501_18_FS]